MSTTERPQTLTITRYLEARRVLMDPLTFSSARPLTTMTDGLGYSFVLFCQDPPEHSRLRALIQKEFISSRLEDLRGWIAQEVDSVLSGYTAAGVEIDVDCDVGIDIVQTLTLPMPMRVINRLLALRLTAAACAKRCEIQSTLSHTTAGRAGACAKRRRNASP